MFEEMATSGAQLLLIIFGIVIFSIVVYSVLWLRVARKAKTPEWLYSTRMPDLPKNSAKEKKQRSD